MTSSPPMQNPDISSNIPFGIKIQGSIENKRQLRNIDRSMKSITRLLKRNNQRIKADKRAEKNKDGKSNKNITTNKINKQKKSKVLLIMNNSEINSELKSTQTEAKKGTPVKIATITKINKTPDDEPSSTNQFKKIIKTYSRKTDHTLNSKVQITLRKISKPSPVEDKEFYPNKPKRTLRTQDDWLKPQPHLKMVCRLEGVIKRKLYTPRQGALQTLVAAKNVQPNYAELGMKGLVRVVDDEGLTEEDFMEILTCPSPVWWEDQHDSSDEYIEDAIPQEILEESDAIEILKQNSKGDYNNEPIDALKDIKISTNDDKFMKKRSKLESLLGNIAKGVQTLTTELKEKTDKRITGLDNNITKCEEVKTDTIDITETYAHNDVNKLKSKNKQETKDNCDRDIINNAGNRGQSIRVKADKSPECNGSDSLNAGKDEKMDVDVITDSKIIMDSESKEDLNKTHEKAISISTDDESLTGSLFDEDVLKDLEDMDIPIDKNEEISINEVVVENVTKPDDSKDLNVEAKSKKNNERSLLLELPTLKNKPSLENKSLLKTLNDIVITKESGQHCKIIDSISDKGVKFITEFDSCIKEPKNEKCVTQNKNDDSNSETPTGKIDSFYKKVRGPKSIVKEDCKLTNQDNKTVPCRSCNSKTNKSLSVTNDKSEKVKYCYDCSSIFDTDKCNYCCNSSKNGNIVPQCCSTKD